MTFEDNKDDFFEFTQQMVSKTPRVSDECQLNSSINGEDLNQLHHFGDETDDHTKN